MYYCIQINFFYRKINMWEHSKVFNTSEYIVKSCKTSLPDIYYNSTAISKPFVSCDKNLLSVY